MVGRAIAWIFLVLALMAAGRDVLLFLESGTYAPSTLGSVWFQLDRGSLDLAQSAIERYLHPDVWQYGLFPLLIWPAWTVLGGVAIVLTVISGSRRRRKWRSGSLG